MSIREIARPPIFLLFTQQSIERIIRARPDSDLEALRDWAKEVREEHLSPLFHLTREQDVEKVATQQCANYYARIPSILPKLIALLDKAHLSLEEVSQTGYEVLQERLATGEHRQLDSSQRGDVEWAAGVLLHGGRALFGALPDLMFRGLLSNSQVLAQALEGVLQDEKGLRLFRAQFMLLAIVDLVANDAAKTDPEIVEALVNLFYWDAAFYDDFLREAGIDWKAAQDRKAPIPSRSVLENARSVFAGLSDSEVKQVLSCGIDQDRFFT